MDIHCYPRIQRAFVSVNIENNKFVFSNRLTWAFIILLLEKIYKVAYIILNFVDWKENIHFVLGCVDLNLALHIDEPLIGNA